MTSPVSAKGAFHRTSRHLSTFEVLPRVHASVPAKRPGHCRLGVGQIARTSGIGVVR